MISHFSLSDSRQSFYLAISTIHQDVAGFHLSGTVGDGSAEAWFEACAGEELHVKVLPIWDAGYDALCQRYDQEQLEQALATALEDIHFRSELAYDRDSGCWQQQITAIAAPELSTSQPALRYLQPHQRVCEPDVIWQRQAVC